MGAGPNWTQAEKDLVSDNMAMPDSVLAEKLGRTAVSINCMKYRLRHETSSTRMRKPISQERDMRPSGWYTEVIGTLLMECPDAYETWKHFHRYVEVKELSADPSWTHLLCRRDTEAP
jgi:hypothetical protein